MFASRYFASRYFAARFYDAGRTEAVVPIIPATRFTTGSAQRNYPLFGFVSLDEKPDTLDAFGVITGHDTVEMDNDFLLLAAA